MFYGCADYVHIMCVEPRAEIVIGNKIRDKSVRKCVLVRTKGFISGNQKCVHMEKNMPL